MKPILRLIMLVLTGLVIFVHPALKLQAQPAQEVRTVTSFENIVIETSPNTYVYVRYDKTPSVTVKTEHRYIDKVTTSVSMETLTIHLNSKHLEDALVEIYVHTPVVKKISLSGGGNVEFVDGFDNTLLQTDISGGGKLQFKESAEINNFQSKVSGGGFIDALKLNVKKATVVVSGGGEVLVQVADQLVARIAGGGNIFYKGDPDVSSSVVGGGRIAKR